LTSEATGRLYFKPDLLGFFDEKQKEPSTIQTNESIPVYKDGDSLKGSVTRQFTYMIHLFIIVGVC
jgi:predicted DNA-binding protein with PD1-like motif